MHFHRSEYKGDSRNILTFVGALFILTPLGLLVFAYTSYGTLWGWNGDVFRNICAIKINLIKFALLTVAPKCARCVTRRHRCENKRYFSSSNEPACPGDATRCAACTHWAVFAHHSMFHLIICNYLIAFHPLRHLQSRCTHIVAHARPLQCYLFQSELVHLSWKKLVFYSFAK